MKGNFEASFKEILHHEGGFVNHSQDPGGATNFGVTKETYEKWTGKRVTIEDMRRLVVEKVKPLYRAMYWDKIKCDDLPIGLDLCVFDFAINAGPQRAVRYLQRLVGVDADGMIGPKTIKAVNDYCDKFNNAYAVMAYQQMRKEYYHQLKTFSIFGRGWLRRVTEVEATAIDMIRKAKK